MKLIGYMRVSTLQQADEGISLDAQQRKIREYCTLFGHELVDLVEDGVSGKNLNRPGIKSVLERLTRRPPEADGLIVVRLDRLSRKLKDVLDLLDEPFDLISVTEQIQKGSASGRFQTQILSAVAELERNLIGERTRDALAEKKAQGMVLGPPPYGWRHAGETGKWIIHETEQAIIADICAMRENGLSFRSIAAQLNARNVPTPHAKQAWGESTVYYIWQRSQREKEEKQT